MSSQPLARPQDPKRLDLRSLARQAGRLEGHEAQSSLQRLAQSVEAAQQCPAVAWSVQGELREVKGAEPQVWLHLAAQTEVCLVCQRCLQSLMVPISLSRSFLFVPDEAQATRLDEELDDDVLVLPRFFDALELLEDELILALPIVPRHEVCPDPLPLPADELSAQEEDPGAAPANPFAVLAALKKPQRPN